MLCQDFVVGLLCGFGVVVSDCSLVGMEMLGGVGVQQVGMVTGCLLGLCCLHLDLFVVLTVCCIFYYYFYPFFCG